MPKRKRFFFQLRPSLRLSTLRNSILVCVLNIIPHTIFFISITIIMIELHCYLAHCFVCLVHDLHLKKCKQLSGTADIHTNLSLWYVSIENRWILHRKVLPSLTFKMWILYCSWASLKLSWNIKWKWKSTAVFFRQNVNIKKSSTDIFCLSPL